MLSRVHVNRVLVGRVLVENITHLSFMKSIISTHIHHDYEREMALESTIVPLSMILKDEKKYDDVVDILDYYEQELEDIYAKAGIIEKPAETKEVKKLASIEGQTSAVDQPQAHFNKMDDDDHMKAAIAVPFGGDQMTRVRFVGTRDLRSGTHTAKERLDHCSPFFLAPFHMKIAFVQVQYTLYFIVNYSCKSHVPCYFICSEYEGFMLKKKRYPVSTACIIYIIHILSSIPFHLYTVH